MTDQQAKSLEEFAKAAGDIMAEVIAARRELTLWRAAVKQVEKHYLTFTRACPVCAAFDEYLRPLLLKE